MTADIPSTGEGQQSQSSEQNIRKKNISGTAVLSPPSVGVFTQEYFPPVLEQTASYVFHITLNVSSIISSQNCHTIYPRIFT